jgi:ribosomal protein L14E/L6E/L27E
MDISKSDIVLSLAGHDRGELFFVIAEDGDHVLIANGKGRKVDNPKRKKRKHVRRVARIDSRVANKLRQGDKVLNSELRKDLAVYKANNPVI